ncbi:MAG: response regulator transcription factor [Sphingobacteriales bacterium]|nr:MAG: response regulator transcription factor [Sphingobacteriales bacterium]
MMQDKIRLAVADDHMQFRRAVVAHLERQGFEILFQAGNGAQLIAQLEYAVALPHACLLDIHMPVMDGVACIEAIRNRWPAIIPVALSIDDAAETAQRAMAAGAAAFFVKGGDPVILKAAIESLVQKRDA